MKLEEAIKIVLELARGNILTEGDAMDNGISSDERNRQFDACEMVEACFNFVIACPICCFTSFIFYKLFHRSEGDDADFRTWWGNK